MQKNYNNNNYNNNITIDIDKLKTEIAHIRKMASERKNISFLITNQISKIAEHYNIPKKIIRKFFLQSTSILEDKEQEEIWLPILQTLI